MAFKWETRKAICFHVDDFIWGGSINFEKQIINVLKETFSVSSQESEPFKYLGVYIDQKNDVITLHQIPYISREVELEFGTNTSRHELSCM